MKAKKNSGSFQLIVDPECTVVLPMTIGTMFTYSGYLITYCQQNRYKDLNEKPFVNIVSYSSKRLFENMMESFRRYLDKAQSILIFSINTNLKLIITKLNI